MLARKTVATGSLRKTLNEKLQSSQKKAGPAVETNSSSESNDYISTSEGDEPGSSEQAKTQETQREVKSCYVFSDVVEREENRFVLIGAARDVGGTDSGKMRKKKKKEPLAICGGGEKGVLKSGGSGEAAEVLINLSKQQDEPGSSDEESLADLLKKVGASYDPKKRKASSQKTPAASKPTKKSKQSPPKSTPRIRATRSRVRESEVELKKALEESKKKRKEKGKAKIGESSEAVVEEEEEEMEQEFCQEALQASAEPVLAKRTRSAAKGKQVKIAEEDDEWSEDEGDESEKEQDRYAMFGKRKILKGRLLKDLEEPGMIRLLTALEAQGWKDMVLHMDGKLARNELVEFMANGTVKNEMVTSTVRGVKVKFNAAKLGKILDIPSEGYDDYTRQRWPCLDGLPTDLQITRNFCDTTTDEEERRHTANYMDLVLMQCLNEGKQINWPAFIVKLLERVLNGSKAHAIPYGFILTTVLERLNVPLKKWKMASSKEHFGSKTLQACDYMLSTAPVEPGSSAKTPVNSKVRALVQEVGAKDAEIARLQARAAELEGERNGLRAELAKEKEKNEGMLQQMLNLLQTQPSSSSKP
ncbi:PREDICTED: uncharacterized protein LOC109221609 [Nicotiana attenuata]|uniref:uncharacterized protein LOC109221609 n=1 Tax=Nicotiana attenuata TaxID=49451 RepID=UPI000904F72A|nr:PREDICTED: uncharacterized protein LOC109221609 [Nicotiana attenuata]